MGELPLQQGILRLKGNEDRFDRFTNGSDVQDFVTSDGEAVPSLRKFLKTKDTEINVEADGILAASVDAKNTALTARDQAVSARDESEDFRDEIAPLATMVQYAGYVFDNLATAQAATIPPGVDTITLRGILAPNDLLGGTFSVTGSPAEESIAVGGRTWYRTTTLDREVRAFRDPVFAAGNASKWASFPAEWAVETRNPTAGSVARKTSPSLHFGAMYSSADDKRAYGSSLFTPCAQGEHLIATASIGYTGVVTDSKVGLFAEFLLDGGAKVIVDKIFVRTFVSWREHTATFIAPKDAVGVRYGILRKGSADSGAVFFTGMKGKSKVSPKEIKGGTSGSGNINLPLGATSFSLFAKVMPIGPDAARQMQDFVFNERTRILYLLHPTVVGGVDQAVVSRCRMDGGKDLLSFDVMNTLAVSSGRGLSIQYNENGTDRLWTSASPDKPGKAIRFRYAAGADATSVGEFQLIPPDIANDYSIYPTVTYDQKYMLAVYHLDGSRYFIRVWDMLQFAQSAGGDFTNEYLFEWPLNELQIDGGLSFQGICSDGVYVYIHTGNGLPETPKKIYAYTLAEGTLVGVIDTSMIANAEYLVDGVTWEPQGLNIYKRGPGAAPQLACTYGTGSGATKHRWIFVLGEEMPVVHRGNGTLPAEIFMNSRAVASPVGTPTKFGSWDGTTYTDRLEINDTGIKTKSIEGTSYTIADDAAIAITVPGPNNTAIAMLNSSLATSTANPQGMVWINADASPAAGNIALRSLTGVVFTSGILTGVTGVDGNFTISAHTDGKLYLENRTGAARTLSLLFLDSA